MKSPVTPISVAGDFSLAYCVDCWYNVLAASYPNLATEGGERMEILLSFIVSVAAGIATYYICKWLDRHDQDKEQ